MGNTLVNHQHMFINQTTQLKEMGIAAEIWHF